MVSSRLVDRGLRLRIPDIPRHYKYARNSQPPAFQKQQLKQPPLKIPATVASKTSGIQNLRPRSTSLEDSIYFSINNARISFTVICLIAYFLSSTLDRELVYDLLSTKKNPNFSRCWVTISPVRRLKIFPSQGVELVLHSIKWIKIIVSFYFFCHTFVFSL